MAQNERPLRVAKGEDPNQGTTTLKPQKPTVVPFGSAKATGSPTPSMAPVYKRLRYQKPVEDDNMLLVSPPPYAAEDVGKAEPQLVAKYKEMLWNKYQRLPASERGSSFWRQVRANPEGAATSMVQRLYANAQMFSSGKTPKLDEAMKARIEQSEIYQLLSFIDYADKNF